MDQNLDLDYTIELWKGIFIFKIIMFTNLKLNYMYYCKNLYLKHTKKIYIYNYIYYISIE